MSEGLRAKYLVDGKIVGQKIADYEYFNVGDVTFNQLTSETIVPFVAHKDYANKKPDRLIVRRRNHAAPSVIAVIEDKDSGIFTSEMERKKAIQQCNNYCQETDAELGIITDGNETIWINPREYNQNHLYIDENTGRERSYSIIKKEDGTELNVNFAFSDRKDTIDQSEMTDALRKIYKTIKTISNVVNANNSIIKEPERIDPLPLAKSVWQAIWIATGKTPEKCLYNVVEIFIFKFLSDLKILDSIYGFDHLYSEFIDKNRSAEETLDYYVRICRNAIHEKFPKGEDGTTIINGTIFVDEYGNANITQANLFKDTIEKFKDFENAQGKFSAHNIDKDFKTKLYEQFLKQTAGLKALGQYFTPRKVVRAVVNMSNINNFRGGERVCDPFCGVGGFILEPLNLPARLNDFKPVNGKINPPVTYRGYDKGFEKDEERTIILAKANMLIYLAEIIAENKDIPAEFARNVFNKTFKLWRSNLGTLEDVDVNEDENFDLILTNPPYVKTGKKTLDNEIKSNSNLKNFYNVNGAGVEGLAIEWIVRHLKKGGKAFVIAPDGIFHRNEDRKLRKFLLDECILDGIISLPPRTFYATPKKTYILAVTRKYSREEAQTTPVFTYLVNNIGETLDINRFETPEKNDLTDMVLLFKQFDGAKDQMGISELLGAQSKLCKIQPIDRFDPKKHWLVDRWWTQQEKIELGIEEVEELLSYDDFIERVNETQVAIQEQLRRLLSSNTSPAGDKQSYKEIYLGDIVDIVRGNSNYTLRYVNEHQGEYPLYSAKTEDGGLMGNINSYQFDEQCVTYTTNGANAGTVFYREEHKFSLNGDAALLRLKPTYSKTISYKYLAMAVQQSFKVEGLGWEYKATNAKVNEVLIKVPVDHDGNYDFNAQIKLVDKQEAVIRAQNEFASQMAFITQSHVGVEE